MKRVTKVLALILAAVTLLWALSNCSTYIIFTKEFQGMKPMAGKMKISCATTLNVPWNVVKNRHW